jgi:amidohydrolase
VAASIMQLEPQLVAWRRDIHANPELSNREFRTSKLVGAHLKSLGLEVRTGVAKTGVVALLRGGRPGPTIALRADMDALPFTEETDVPFRSRVTTTYRGETVGVMHACGHDGHTAMLMAVASALTRERAALPGNVLFIFQPAEEGPPEGEDGGAPLMLKEGLFDTYRPEAVFGLHVQPILRTGELGYRAGPMMAASDFFRILVKGRQSHGARPWQGIDPIVAAAQIVQALQPIVSRQTDLTQNPAVVTIGQIRGGVRYNVVPDEVEMLGTIRTFDPQQREAILAAVKRVAENTAAAQGATATVDIDPNGNPVLFNNRELTERVRPSLERVAGATRVRAIGLQTGAEDFAYFAQRVPAVYFYVGVTPPTANPVTAPGTHSNRFYLDEAALPIGAKAMAAVALDYLRRGAGAPRSTADGAAP